MSLIHGDNFATLGSTWPTGTTSARYRLKVNPLLLLAGKQLTSECEYVHVNRLRSQQLHDAYRA
jgi:hypothetical protein